jgi:transcriptional regulator with XRE-family HTH domain
VATIRKWTGREVRALRAALGMNARELGWRLGVSDRAIAQWESRGGEVIPREDKNTALSRILERSSEDARARFRQFLAGEAEIPETEADREEDLWDIAIPYLERRGMSVRALSKAVYRDNSVLNRVLHGKKKCGAALARDIDKAIGADGEFVKAAARIDSASSLASPVNSLKTAEELKAKRLAEQLRRSFLAGGLAALTLPALGLDELKHIAAAVVNAQRYADNDIVDYFKRQLGSCAANDGRRGPRQSLPIVLGLIAAIEKIATDAKPATRRDLLNVGAYASEFAGWLYRDVCVPELANYWRDRAIEWAQVSGDSTMQGYVLLKKSQAVWDERDALRMLTLAEAAQEGPWRLPARVRAEAAQQQARGHAMLNGNLALVESTLSEARSLLDQDRANSDARTTEIAAHYDEALFGLQVAICYCEAGQPERSLELYDRWLSPETFSRRDYAYFLALKGEAHAIAEEPDNAATAGLAAFSLARETESVRTVQEVTRLAVQLEQWRDRESVHDLCKSVLVS